MVLAEEALLFCLRLLEVFAKHVLVMLEFQAILHVQFPLLIPEVCLLLVERRR